MLLSPSRSIAKRLDPHQAPLVDSAHPEASATNLSLTSREFTMFALRTLVVLFAATLVGACAGPGGMHASPHAAHGPGMAHVAKGPHGPMAAMEPRMVAMQEMHRKMEQAGTPAERQALMADHMKAMQGGMAMMKEMHAMHAGHVAGGMCTRGSHGGTAPMGGMCDAKGMAADMAKHHQMMGDHMTMMQMMMDMMGSRMPSKPPGQ
jgi:hypothetical protein